MCVIERSIQPNDRNVESINVLFCFDFCGDPRSNFGRTFVIPSDVTAGIMCLRIYCAIECSWAQH